MLCRQIERERQRIEEVFVKIQPALLLTRVLECAIPIARVPDLRSVVR